MLKSSLNHVRSLEEQFSSLRETPHCSSGLRGVLPLASDDSACQRRDAICYALKHYSCRAIPKDNRQAIRLTVPPPQEAEAGRQRPLGLPDAQAAQLTFRLRRGRRACPTIWASRAGPVEPWPDESANPTVRGDIPAIAALVPLTCVDLGNAPREPSAADGEPP